VTGAGAGEPGHVAATARAGRAEPVVGGDAVPNTGAASGGQDLESRASMGARAPLAQRAQDRVVTDEDAVVVAEAVAGCERAKAVGNSFFNGTYVQGAGSMSVGIVAADSNQVANATLVSDVASALEFKGLPGLTYAVFQAPVRLVYIDAVAVELVPGALAATVSASIQAALADYFTALDVLAADGVTVSTPGWTFGETAYANEVISLIDRVDGVKRVGAITFVTSDDYGSSWTSSAAITDVAPGPAGGLTDAFGEFRWGAGSSPPSAFALTEL